KVIGDRGRVLKHPHEEMPTPAEETTRLRYRNDLRLAREKRSAFGIDMKPAFRRELQDMVDARIFAKTESRVDAPQAPFRPLDLETLGILDVGRIDELDADEDAPLVQHHVVLEIVQERTRVARA